MVALRRASVIGAGLIGGSIGMALRDRGWHVSATDLDDAAVARGIEIGAFDAAGLDGDADVVFVATPVDAVVAAVRIALDACPHAIVTDVGGVKAAIVDGLDADRFIGGHPMAGSERLGIDGADEELFNGAAWVLTPGPHSSDETYGSLRALVSDLGAEVLTMAAAEHDLLVATVSHVPHLTAASLVRVARAQADDHRALLRLAAGGFRDMTRIAAGSPAIWPDVCAANRDAIVATLDHLLAELGAFRAMVLETSRGELHAALAEAQAVRRALPTRGEVPDQLIEVRVPVPDRPGAIAEVATLATQLGVNLHALQTVDASEGGRGFLLLLVAPGDAARLLDALVAEGHRGATMGPGDIQDALE